jgi:hypothetical protein
MFRSAIEAYCNWQPGTPQPTVEFEVHYEAHPITLRRACGLLWHCTDILRRDAFDALKDAGLEPRSTTYGAATHAMRAELQRHDEKPEIPRPSKE